MQQFNDVFYLEDLFEDHDDMHAWLQENTTKEVDLLLHWANVHVGYKTVGVAIKISFADPKKAMLFRLKFGDRLSSEEKVEENIKQRYGQETSLF